MDGNINRQLRNLKNVVKRNLRHIMPRRRLISHELLRRRVRRMFRRNLSSMGFRAFFLCNECRLGRGIADHHGGDGRRSTGAQGCGKHAARRNGWHGRDGLLSSSRSVPQRGGHDRWFRRPQTRARHDRRSREGGCHCGAGQCPCRSARRSSDTSEVVDPGAEELSSGSRPAKYRPPGRRRSTPETFRRKR